MSWQLVVALGLGALTWSFLEYCIHRWLGHDKRFRPNFFAHEHVRHHSQGDYFAPTGKKILMSGAVFALLVGPAILIAGAGPGLAYCAGLAGFYACYELLHRLEHVWEGFGPYGRWARRHHFYHHFVDPKANHGVTSPIWDVVFGTYRAADKIVVPERLMMRWLGDADSGIRPELSGTYVLKRRAAA